MLIESKTNIWVQQNYNYDLFCKRSNEMLKQSQLTATYW